MTDHGEEHMKPDRADGDRGWSVLGRRARELAHTPIAAGAERLGRERLLLTVAFMRPKAETAVPARRMVAWLSLAAAAIVLLGLGFRRFGADRPLTYEIEGAQLLAANYLVAPSTGNAGVRFSDGSQISAAPGTRLRVDSTRSDGARVLLEVGSTSAHVKHNQHSSWVFVAGPFDVHITGTRFSLAWDTATQAVDLTLIDGSVEVESPLGASQILVKTGQRFRASLIAGTMQLENSDGSAAPALSVSAPRSARTPSAQEPERSVTAPGPTEPDASAHSEQANLAAGSGEPKLAAGSGEPSSRAANSRVSVNPRGRQGRMHTSSRAANSRGSSVTWLDANTTSENSAPATKAENQAKRAAQTVPAARDLAPPERWTDLVRAGSFDAVIEAANTTGLADSLERGSAEVVRALADAARYTERSALAIRSLTVLRTRFAGTHHATAAAFLLGRTFENGHQDEDAKRFYQLYLREAGRGEFAAEALAGKMRMVARLDGADEARPIAQEYLDRYPNGVHAKSARRLLDTH